MTCLLFRRFAFACFIDQSLDQATFISRGGSHTSTPELKQQSADAMLLLAAATGGIWIHIQVEIEFWEILEGEGKQEPKIRDAVAIVA